MPFKNYLKYSKYNFDLNSTEISKLSSYFRHFKRFVNVLKNCICLFIIDTYVLQLSKLIDVIANIYLTL